MSLQVPIEVALVAKMRQEPSLAEIMIYYLAPKSPILPCICFTGFSAQQREEFERLNFDIQLQLEVWAYQGSNDSLFSPSKDYKQEGYDLLKLTDKIYETLAGEFKAEGFTFACVNSITIKNLKADDNKKDHAILTLNIGARKWLMKQQA